MGPLPKKWPISEEILVWEGAGLGPTQISALPPHWANPRYLHDSMPLISTGALYNNRWLFVLSVGPLLASREPTY